MALSWPFVLLPAAYRTWRSFGSAKARAAVRYLLPFPLAALLLSVLVPLDIPLRARFELSEGAVSDFAERHASTDGESFSGSEWVGLFKIDYVSRRQGCLILGTPSFAIDEAAGLAYCTGGLPSSPTVRMDHIEGRWWKYVNLH